MAGRQIYLRCSHTCNHYPIGQQFPRDPDLLRRDLWNLKVMGFNAFRFIWGGASRTQLDLCDEIPWTAFSAVPGTVGRMARTSSLRIGGKMTSVNAATQGRNMQSYLSPVP